MNGQIKKGVCLRSLGNGVEKLRKYYYLLNERMSILERGPADTVLALALIHHLAISNNLPFRKIADFLAKICNWLIIEFVPKSDSQVQKLLSSREDIFADYTRRSFESEFGEYFTTQDSSKIRDTERTLYLMRRR